MIIVASLTLLWWWRYAAATAVYSIIYDPTIVWHHALWLIENNFSIPTRPAEHRRALEKHLNAPMSLISV